MEKEYFLKLLSSSLTGEIEHSDLVLLNKAIAENTAYKEISDSLSNYLNQLKSSPQTSTTSIDSIWDRIAKAEASAYKSDIDPSSSMKISFLQKPYFKWVAVFAFACLIGLSSYLYFSKADNYLNLSAKNEKTFKVLEDGTSLWLNKNSSVKYNANFGKYKREIFLDGEAYFKVIKNSKVPLFVHLNHLDIEVKGTTFNVKAYKKDNVFQVALIEGSIQVNDKTDKKRIYLLKPNDVLTFSNQVDNNGNSNFIISKVNALKLIDETKWINDTLQFKNEKLKDLAIKLEKKYNVEIEIISEQLKEKRFTGKFINTNFKNILEALKTARPFNYEINGNKAVLRD